MIKLISCLKNGHAARGDAAVLAASANTDSAEYTELVDQLKATEVS